MNSTIGAQKAIFRQGCKYSKKVGDHSNPAFPACSASPRMVNCPPPHVVYKGHNVYNSWCQREPKAAIHTRSPLRLVQHVHLCRLSFQDLPPCYPTACLERSC